MATVFSMHLSMLLSKNMLILTLRMRKRPLDTVSVVLALGLTSEPLKAAALLSVMMLGTELQEPRRFLHCRNARTI
jgi:ABC-type dipeptide/oligopeptide/nickel transport system permease component